MRIVRWEDLESGKDRVTGPVALTIGVFDGLHIGHQKLIQAIRSGDGGALPVVLTFTSSPAVVLAGDSLRPGDKPGRILSLGQKLAKLERLGVAVVVLIDFSRDFSTLTGKEFLEKLKRFFRVRKFVVGYNFSFGRNRDTDVYALRKYLTESGIRMEVIEPTMYQDEVVSSSRIRRDITAGRLRQASCMLGEEYGLDLTDLPAGQEKDGWIEVSLSGIDQILPPEGEYDVLFLTDRGKIPAKLVVTESGIQWSPHRGGEVKGLVFMEHAQARRTECQ